jgi:hypothetical protein
LQLSPEVARLIGSMAKGDLSQTMALEGGSPVARLGWDRVLPADEWGANLGCLEASLGWGTGFEAEHRLRSASEGSERWHLARAVLVRTSAKEVSHWWEKRVYRCQEEK